MTPLARIALALCLGGTILGCDRPQVEWAPNLDPPAKDSLAQWLFCVDCPAGDDTRAAALNLGSRAIRGLSQVLTGPPELWRTNMTARYGRMARRIGRSGDSARIVEAYLGDFDAAVQRRSALLLGEIGTPEAENVLREAIASAETRRYRRDVVRALHEAMLSSTVGPYDGTLSSRTPAFLDTVRLRRGSLAWDGNESVLLNGAPFPNDVVVRRWSTDSLAFIAAGSAGRYALSITNLGANNTAQWDTLHIRSFPAAPWLTPRDVAPSDLPLTVVQSLARMSTPRDTLHSFRFRPVADLQVTARLEWSGGAMSSVWNECAAQSFPGPPQRVAGVVVDQSGDPLSASTVTLIGTGLNAMTGPQGQFSIMGVPPGWQGDMRATRIGYASTTRSAAEGRAGYWLVLRPPGPPVPPFVPQVASGDSAIISSLTVPGGACRILSITKTDTTSAATIARLRLTTP